MKKSSFQFREPKLLEMEFHLNKGFKSSDGKIAIRITPKVNIQKDDGGEKSAFVSLEILVGSEDDESPFFLHAVEGSQFKWTEDAEPYIDSLLQQNAPALLISYLRPCIAMITSASPYSAYNLPFVDFSESDEGDSEGNNE